MLWVEFVLTLRIDVSKENNITYYCNKEIKTVRIKYELLSLTLIMVLLVGLWTFLLLSSTNEH